MFTQIRAGSNGTNMNYSRHQRGSRLHAVLRYIKAYGRAEKDTILHDALFVKKSRKVVRRTWGTVLFSAMVRSRMLTKKRVGQRVFYSLGRRGRYYLTGR